ncbi:MAG: Nif3-like dinuclear metal center hexameric protein [Clostridia bacterium]|nr:Nif3-like dinuclear metal center hexameric protein [Clostridia bacterium]
MELNEFLSMMERIVPKAYAMDGDNVGLLVGTDRTEIRKVLVALDCTVKVAKEAQSRDADLVLCHHPLFYDGVKRFLPNEPQTAAAYILARNGIAMFAAHTNLDAVEGGVNDALCEALGLTHVVPLEPDRLGRLGYAREGTTLLDLMQDCTRAMNCSCRYSGRPDAPVSKVAVIGGSGGGDLLAAVENGADAFVTGEVKYHHFLNAAVMGLNLVVCGHYETEALVLKSLISRLQMEKNDVQYMLTQTGNVAPCSRFGG